MWAKFLEKGPRNQPQYWFADEDRLVVLTRVTLDGQAVDEADVLTFRRGKVVKFQSASDTTLLKRIFGARQSARRMS